MPFSWLARHLEDLALILAMGVLSGLAQFWINLRSGKGRFSLVALAGECLISGSAALIAGLAVIDHLPQGLAFSVAGVAGHMGTRFLFVAEKALADRLAGRQPRRRSSDHPTE